MTRQVSRQDATTVKKALYTYLKSFSPTIQALRLIWLGHEGQSPTTLHLNADLGIASK